MAILVQNVTWDGEDPEPVQAIADTLAVEPSRIETVLLVKKSLDARHGRQRWQAVFKVDVRDEGELLARSLTNVRRWTSRDEGRYGLDAGGPERVARWPERLRPIVVGAGPAGLFAALYLAEAGAEVLLLERGSEVRGRVKAVNGYWRGRRPLDPENNLLFGEGGAGTFSDGKIYTRRRDGELGFIFRRLVDFGADPMIVKEAWAHLGTDRVRAILPVFRERLRELGVEIRYDTRVDDVMVESGRCVGVRLADGSEIRGGPVLFGPGHSARDALTALVRAGAEARPAPIAIGARIEHPQGLVDRAQYGKDDRGELPAASYRLSLHREGRRKVHTFCMCPGGMVVPASNQPDRVVVNGMSFAARSAYWANSAVIVEVTPDDFAAAGAAPGDPLGGFAWQDAIERRAFELTGGTGAAPAQRYTDLASNRPSSELPRTSFPTGVQPHDLRALLPEPIVSGMLDAVAAWDDKLTGFASEQAVFIAPETRTTSPLRFVRTDEGESASLPGLFPMGEGAGYGGGIVSSALDGYRAARALVQRARDASGRTASG